MLVLFLLHFLLDLAGELYKTFGYYSRVGVSLAAGV